MNKLEAQQRILNNGKTLDIKDFSWCESTQTVSTIENYCSLMFDNDINIISGNFSTQTVGNYSTQKAGFKSTQIADDFSTQIAGDYSTQKAGSESTQKADDFSTQIAGDYSTQTAGFVSTQKAGDYSTQKAGDYSTQKAGDYSTQKAGDYSTQIAGCESTQTVGFGSTCISTYLTRVYANGNNVAARRTDIADVVILNEGESLQWCPIDTKGYVKDGIYSETGEKAIIADNIFSIIINKKGNVYKVINHGENKETFLIEQGDIYSHGDTIKEAKESLIYKISNRDTSLYDEYTLYTSLSRIEAIKMYRVITGACESGTRHFVEHNTIPDNLLVSDIINITSGSFGGNIFKEFFKKEK